MADEDLSRFNAEVTWYDCLAAEAKGCGAGKAGMPVDMVKQAVVLQLKQLNLGLVRYQQRLKRDLIPAAEKALAEASTAYKEVSKKQKRRCRRVWFQH